MRLRLLAAKLDVLQQRNRCLAIFAITLAFSSCILAPALAESGFVETFADDPVTGARLQLHDGDGSRFAYQAADHSLLARYNTARPTARLIRPLCRPLTQSDSFEITVTFRIRSAGFIADTRRNAQIAFGLMNSITTGTDRVYGLNNGGTFDLMSFDYYPNITLFGGPSLGPTFINHNIGQGFSSAIDFGFGPETQMDGIGEGPLPLDTWLTAEMRYSGPDRVATLRVLNSAGPLAINTVGDEYEAGGLDGDPTTIITKQAGVGFTVDSFGIFLWTDTSATFPTVIADVDFQRIELNWSAGGDFDGDGDVDEADLAHYHACRTAPAVMQRIADCLNADLDCDGDVDQEDFGQLQAAIKRPS
jgi:hypothetical protein